MSDEWTAEGARERLDATSGTAWASESRYEQAITDCRHALDALENLDHAYGVLAQEWHLAAGERDAALARAEQAERAISQVHAATGRISGELSQRIRIAEIERDTIRARTLAEVARAYDTYPGQFSGSFQQLIAEGRATIQKEQA